MDRAFNSVNSTSANPEEKILYNKGQAVLFAGQLNYDATEQDVYQLFSHYGDVVNVVLLQDKNKGGKRREDCGHASSGGTSRNTKLVIGSSAFITFNNTAEADLAIVSLHGRYCMDDREKPIQVSYCQKTDIISDFGYQHALKLHQENPANPVPPVRPSPPS